MKNKIYYKILGAFALLVALVSCDPFMEDNPESSFNLPPDPAEMDFSITQADDAFHYKVELVSPAMSGIYSVAFDLGNGSMVKKSSTVAYYPMPGDYTITMTITTNAGSSSVSKSLTTTETDYTIFTDEKYIFLTGGIENKQGRTWRLEAETPGHLGVGPAADPNSSGLEWWSASPFQKATTGAYDDEITFKIEGFAVTYDNKGVSYVKNYRASDTDLAQYYLNPRENDTDFDVDYQTPVSGTWSFVEKEDGLYLKLSSEKPLFPCFDVGAQDNEYKVLSITNTRLELAANTAAKYDPGLKWHYFLIPTDYQKPQVEYSISVDATGDINTFGVTFTVINIPAGESINKITVDFGDGTVKETTDVNEVFSNTYMRKGTYNVTVTTETSVETKTEAFPVVVAENHPDYQEFLLDEIVMYADFSEVMLAPVEGENCAINVVDNPSNIYPNKSSKVAFYSKTNQPWANAFLKLPAGYRFDLRQKHTFKLKVYGKAGDQVLLKLENTDRGGNAWQTGTADLIYTIQKDNTWEIAEYEMAGNPAGWDWTGDIFTADVVADDNFNHDFYNVVRIMLNPGVDSGTHEFYFDELAGPHVEGIKSATIK